MAMVRGLMFFFVMWGVVHLGITVFRELTGKEKWHATKTALFAASTAFVALCVIGIMVALF